MRGIKTMSIIGIVLASFSIVCLIGFDNPIDYEAAIGWGIYATIYLLAFSITALVKVNKK